MNFQHIFVLIQFTAMTECDILAIKHENDTKLVSNYILSVCEDFFIRKSMKFDVIVFESSSERINDIRTGIIKEFGQKYPIRTCMASYFKRHYFENSALILIKDMASYLRYLETTIFVSFDPTIIKIIVYVDDTQFSIPDMVDFHDHPYLRSVEYYILNSNDTLTLATYDSFSRTNCTQQELKILQKFDKIKKTSTKNVKNHKKFYNFNGCPLIITPSYGPLLFLKVYNQKVKNCKKSRKTRCNQLSVDQYEKPQGFSVDFFKILAKIHNFKPDFQIIKKSHTAARKGPTVDVMMSSISSDSVMSSLFQEFSYIFITKTTTLDTFELLTHSFNFHTWIAVLTSLFVAFIVIFYMKLRLGIVRIHPRKELTRPALNVLQIVFGCPQKKLPRANFGRFLIILFIGLCLVLRICYWSQLVGFMTSRVDKMESRTVEDLIDGSYTVYTCSEDNFLIESETWNNIRVNTDCEMSSINYCEILQNSKQNVGFVTEKRMLATFTKICNELNLSVMIIDESKIMFTFTTEYFSFFNSQINDIIDKLVPTGLALYLMDQHTRDYYIVDDETKKNNVKILNLEDFKFLVILWIILAGISIVLFILEYSIAAVKEILIYFLRKSYSSLAL
ncbi:unnamed protein product [Chironomus riparius]|uniref:Ionotropic receptor n=1 Tax=Chironomus riparius TaxID=315576 RepID=A0A9N9WXY7_9DIPT|nr:unnamed protein product [Chironomus riparius]